MLDYVKDSIEDRVFSVVSRLLRRHGIFVAFTAECNLVEIGLTSLDIVNLILAVEDELELTIPESAMIPNNFRSIAAIKVLVSVLRSNAPAVRGDAGTAESCLHVERTLTECTETL